MGFCGGRSGSWSLLVSGSVVSSIPAIFVWVLYHDGVWKIRRQYSYINTSCFAEVQTLNFIEYLQGLLGFLSLDCEFDRQPTLACQCEASCGSDNLS